MFRRSQASPEELYLRAILETAMDWSYLRLDYGPEGLVDFVADAVSLQLHRYLDGGAGA